MAIGKFIRHGSNALLKMRTLTYIAAFVFVASLHLFIRKFAILNKLNIFSSKLLNTGES